MRTFCEKHNLEKTFNKYYECKICTKEYKDAYYKKHREKYMKKMKEYYEKNKEVLHEKMREYHEKNKEKIQKYWIEYSKTYIKTEKARIIRKGIVNKRRAIMKSGEKVTGKILSELLSSQDYKCNDCSTFLDLNIPKFVHLDHIIPLAKGGEHKISNLQYLCQKCNCRKGKKILFT